MVVNDLYFRSISLLSFPTENNPIWITALESFKAWLALPRGLASPASRAGLRRFCRQNNGSDFESDRKPNYWLAQDEPGDKWGI
jgi:hypothetical protein